MTRHFGRCHCGAVQFEADTDLAAPYRCNCSFCIRRGTVMQIIPAEAFRLTAGETELTGYGERDFAKHYFCRHCGIQCFTRIQRAKENAISLNIGCLEGVDPLQHTPSVFDGATRL